MTGLSFSRKKPAVVSTPPFMIQVQNICKDFDNKRNQALKDLNLNVSKGEIFGLIGANGAGKTTALKIMATILPPTSGDVLINGLSVRKDPVQIRRLLGYVPDEFGLYSEMQIEEYLEFFAACYGIHGTRRVRLVNELLDLVDLKSKRTQLLKGLSRGMKQRLCLAHALVHDPQILLLDEPASGLDPRARLELRELLRELAYLGKTIVISSHVVSDVQDICDKVGIMAHGHILEYGTTGDVSDKGVQGLHLRRITVRVVTTNDLETLQKIAPHFNALDPDTITVDQANRRVELEINGDESVCAAFLSFLTNQGVAVTKFVQQGTGLEELFVEEV